MRTTQLKRVKIRLKKDYGWSSLYDWGTMSKGEICDGEIGHGRFGMLVEVLTEVKGNPSIIYLGPESYAVLSPLEILAEAANG